jgi:hypothetical protein
MSNKPTIMVKSIPKPFQVFYHSNVPPLPYDTYLYPSGLMGAPSKLLSITTTMIIIVSGCGYATLRPPHLHPSSHFRVPSNHSSITLYLVDSLQPSPTSTLP